MAASFSDTSFTSTSFTTVSPPVVTPPGVSGGRVRKRVGRQLVTGPLGSRPSISTTGESKGKIKLTVPGLSKSRLSILVKSESTGITIPHTTGYSNSRLSIKSYNKSKSQLLYKTNGESWGVIHPSILMERVNINQVKIAKIAHYMKILEQIDSLPEATPNIKSFEFSEQVTDPILRSFTASSSFVGNVRYNRETQGMRILLNGKAFNFCNVPERVFDAFEGAASKGAFFARNIRTQFDC